MAKPDPSYIVHSGDATMYFEFGKVYRSSYVKDEFRKRIRKCARCSHPVELFPGLILRDGAGNLWKPKLRVVLVPAKPGEEFQYGEASVREGRDGGTTG